MPLTRKIAYIDLSTGEIRKELIPERMRRLFLGGRGIDAYLLYNHTGPETDPIGPENVLLVSAGLLCGSPAPASARTHVGGKSPVTGILGSTNMGGFFAPELTFAGFHHLVVKGKAEKPVYLWIHNGEIEIRDASHLWGKDILETQLQIRADHGDPEVKVMCIGIGGENLVRIANVKTGMKNAGGRTGMGCVMGSKNLKAIAARGTMDLKLAYPAEALEFGLESKDHFMGTKVATALGYDGTMFIWNITNTTGMLRVKNSQLNKLEDWEGLTIEEFHDKYRVGTVACFNCPVHCRHQWRINNGPYAGTFWEGPEYNTQMALGNNLFIRTWEPILIGQYLTDIYGIDFSEVGNLLAWSMELYQRGLIDKKITQGLDLDWENAPNILPVVIEQIAKREGFGELLADGAYGYIDKLEKLGVDRDKAWYYFIGCKGHSALATDDRASKALAFGAGVSSRGWDHLRSRPAIDHYHLPVKVMEELYDGGPMSSEFKSYVGKAREIWWFERHYAVVDSVGTCKFHSCFFSPHGFKWEHQSKWIKYITGLDISPEELREIGSRIYTLERMYNNREGLGRKDDWLSDFMYEVPMPVGLDYVRGEKLDRDKWNEMLDEYYALHGWDNEGVPTEETLKRLSLDKEPSHIL
jgi:aldehyde:ferredoxin oxidoreductase